MSYRRFLATVRSRKTLQRYIAEVKSWDAHAEYGTVQLIRPVERFRTLQNITPFVPVYTPTTERPADEPTGPALFMHKRAVFHKGYNPDIYPGMQVEVTPDLGAKKVREVTLPDQLTVPERSFDKARESSCAPKSWHTKHLQCKIPKQFSTLREDVDT